MNLVRVEGWDENYGDFIKKYDEDNEIIRIKYGINVYNPRLFPLNNIFVEYYTDYYSDLI